ncbi:DUF3857 domain-containing protein [Psychromonas sp. MME2]|uniref:DUF3857 domain-containing protein n=1 Tax=Psychromonas sp. MME2 TaxID=3231033 RepID=UPI00339BB90F
MKFANGQATVYNRNVEQPLTTEGVMRSSRVEVSFNPVYQKLVWHKVTVKRGAKEMNRLSSSAITLLQREQSLDQEIVDGYVTAMLVIDDTRKGDVIDYSYSIEGRNPIYGQHAFFNTFMGWTIPLLNSTDVLFLITVVIFNISSINLMINPLFRKKMGSLSINGR